MAPLYPPFYPGDNVFPEDITASVAAQRLRTRESGAVFNRATPLRTLRRLGISEIRAPRLRLKRR